MRWLLFSILVVPALAWGDAAEIAAKLDALNAQRDDPAVAKQLDALVETGLKQYPDDYGVLWRAARWKVWLADGSSGDRKRDFGKEAWELGDRARKKNPSGVEGNYFAAIGIGAYSQAVGILKALTQGLEGQFNDRLDASIKEDPSLMHGGPWMAKGRYYYELPWPKRDLGKSAELLKKTNANYPENLRAYLYLAETQLKDGKAKEANLTLAKAKNGPVDYDPPEGRRIHELAKGVQAQIDKELQ